MILFNTTSTSNPLPNRFTGKFKGQYYYLGRLWLGPNNAIGNRQGRLRAEFSGHSKSVKRDVMTSRNPQEGTKFAPGGQCVVDTICTRPGPFEYFVRDGMKPAIRPVSSEVAK